MNETDGRLAPVSYLFGARPSVSSSPVGSAPAGRVEPAWNDAWGDDVASGEVGRGEAAQPPLRGARSHDRGADAGADVESDASHDDEPVAVDPERISMKALNRRAVSRRELERLLRNAGVDEVALAHECDRLTRVGLIDDAALAQTLVGILQERKGLGRTAIAAELARRMLAPAAIEYALDLVDTGDELARARELARKRATQMSGLDRDAAVRRLSGYLARRGYSGSTVRAAVDEALPLRAASTVRFR